MKLSSICSEVAMNTGIFELVRNMADISKDNISHNSSDYRNEDGLLMCGKCHTAKQIRISNGLGVIEPYVDCECEKLRKKHEDELRAEHERREYIHKLRRKCFPPDSFRKMSMKTFANNDGQGLAYPFKVARNYAEHFPQMYEKGIGFTFFGSVGVGKSYLAACIANSIIDQGYSALMTDFPTIINRIQSRFEGREEYIAELMSYSLLIIDDLGVERCTEFANEIVNNVVEHRCKCGKPLIVTTNLTPDHFLKSQVLHERRLYSRLFECSLPINCIGDDRRMEKFKDNFTELADILGLEMSK